MFIQLVQNDLPVEIVQPPRLPSPPQTEGQSSTSRGDYQCHYDEQPAFPVNPVDAPHSTGSIVPPSQHKVMQPDSTTLDDEAGAKRAHPEI